MQCNTRVLCRQCGFLFSRGLKHCCYCGRINDRDSGSLSQSWNWFKDAVGWLENAPGNLMFLEKEVESRIADSARQMSDIQKQLKSITGAVGLNDLIREVRGSFLKSGGGSINELLKDFADSDKSGFDVFNSMTDPDFLLQNSCFPDQLEKLKLFLQVLGKNLADYHNSHSFQPRDQLEALLKKSISAIMVLQKDAAKIEYFDQVFSASFQALMVLGKKLQEYSILRFAIGLEFWKADGAKFVYEAFTRSVINGEFDKKIESLKSEGLRKAEQMRESFPGVPDIDGLVERIDLQIKNLEDARFAYATQKVLGVAEGVNAIDGGYPETQRLLEKFFAREQSVEINFSAQILQSYEKAKEEEIRILAEKRIENGINKVVRGDNPFGKK
ncbi:MAG: hypothetical protein ACD_39C01893G0003 [uncultured bacterium]|nr:MAG: hypothetical protein ACD_39C01893G0003 [uncultured bacterium]